MNSPINAAYDDTRKAIRTTSAVNATPGTKGSQETTISNSTSETTVVTAVASIYQDMYGLILANSGSSATKVTIRDTTAGSVKGILYVPAGDTRGFMLPVNDAIEQTAVNTNWTAQCTTATTALDVTALYVKRT